MSTVRLEALVADNSALRSLPQVLESQMRMRIDALVYSADAISHNWNLLKLAAAHVGTDPKKLDHGTRAAMLSAAWSIVDELDAVRQLVASMVTDGETPGPFTTNLLAACAPVQRLRNKMRHLSGNLKRLSQMNGKRSALFGALSWFWCPDPSTGEGWCVMTQSGMLHGGETMSIANPAGRDISPPADLFQLNAFAEVLVLSVPVSAFSEWIEASAQDWIAQIDEKIVAHLAATDEDEAKLRSHMGGNFSLFFKINFPPSAVVTND